MAYIVMAYMAMDYIVMAYVFMDGLNSYGLSVPECGCYGL